MHFVHVALPARVFHAFTYRLPERCPTPHRGARVIVPLGRRRVVGIVTELVDAPPTGFETNDIKPIERILDDTPILAAPLLQLIAWMAAYYCAPIGEVCRTALPKRLFELGGPRTLRPTEPNEFIDVGVVREPPLLTAAQKEVRAQLIAPLQNQQSPTALLHGITGSGKTEVYLQLFEEVVKQGGQAILLVPEIGLTPQLAHRVTGRFGKRVAIYHSGLTDAQRHHQWERMRSGDAAIVVGTRSALFAPFPNLKAIAVDEEHDSSYKQEDGGVLYNARDAAIMRGKLEGAVVVLGSATPSLESFAAARSGKYHYLHLPDRATGAKLPTVEIVDMRKAAGRRRGGSRTAPTGYVSLSEPLAHAIDETLARREQTLLFLNRRGFARFLLCTACGHVPICPNCNISLSLHMGRRSLVCHYCEYAIALLERCPSCKSPELLPSGSGTERLEAEIRDFFPTARVTRLDRDTSEKSGVRNKIFRDMNHGAIDILIGTQLITKGHDFPNVTLVGIVSSDNMLHLPDFRAAERTFQLITQVAGRAGRATKAGKVIVQTYLPHHHSLICAQNHDVETFAREELPMRESLSYPPYTRLVNIRFAGNREDRVEKGAHAIADILRTKTVVLGPAASPLEKIRGKFRWQLLIKARDTKTIATTLCGLHEQSKSLLPAGVRMTIDVDPTNLL
ncbi:MAG: primosomal protein N' [Deltaproteobacteria bacterium]|nr:primosomal protein N' [Deltaproteobacteria bacterium]